MEWKPSLRSHNVKYEAGVKLLVLRSRQRFDKPLAMYHLMSDIDPNARSKVKPFVAVFSRCTHHAGLAKQLAGRQINHLAFSHTQPKGKKNRNQANEINNNCEVSQSVPCASAPDVGVRRAWAACSRVGAPPA